MPGGEYYIGDLCYVLTGDEWAALCRLMSASEAKGAGADGIYTLADGRAVALMSTGGDGGFYDNDGAQYSVDSGTIGCILSGPPLVDSLRLGQIVEFPEPFAVGRAGDYLQFGFVSIDTDHYE